MIARADGTPDFHALGANTVAEGGNRRWAETARLPAKLSGARALHALTSGNQPEDHVAVALARTAHGPETVDHLRLKPDVALAILIDRVLLAYAAQRQGRSDGLEGGWSDGDADHDRFRRSAMDTTSAGVGRQKDAHASMSSRRLSSASPRR